MNARRALLALATLCLALAASPGAASGSPLRLRGDALASAEAPVGLLSLQADSKLRPWLTAEALVWTAVGDQDEADALVVAVKVRDPGGLGDLRLGRFVLATGALMPVHVDGALARVRTPWGFSVESFAGLPVAPRFGERRHDWLVGGRVSRATSDWGSAGVAYLHRRDHGNLSDHELGVDGALVPLPWLDLAGRAAYDLMSTGVSEAHASVAARRGAWRVEAFATHRSPSRILPATSLFSVIGDVPSRRFGASARWRAAPRLDVNASAALRLIDDEAGESLSARALLRLDERGDGALGLELRRERAPDAGWTGARGTARVPVGEALAAVAELELAVPDDGRGRGDVWPWALVGARWAFAPDWDAAAAVEASASPEHSHRVDAMARISRRWELASR